MKFTRDLFFIVFVNLTFLLTPFLVNAIEISGHLTGEYRRFYDSPIREEQKNNNLSIAAEPEFYQRISDSSDSFTFTPFFRLDENDSERTHWDIRELNWNKVNPSWELVIGIDHVFWGVAETVHLVNIINQIDRVESFDEEDFLGQPMIKLTFIESWGALDIFAMSGFREMTFPGRTGRPGSNILVSNDKAIYESGAEEWRTDFAARWSQITGIWDVGLSYFYGTSREPRFDPSVSEVNRYGEIELIPIYDIIHQAGIDIQGTFEEWLIKLEAIHRSGQEERFFAAATGFEYTFDDILSSGMDVGLIGEYLYDERDFSAMNDDVAVGVRVSFNDIQSTEILAAVIQDLENGSRNFYVEAARRLGNSFKLSVEIRGVSNVDAHDPLVAFETDGYIQIALGYYF